MKHKTLVVSILLAACAGSALAQTKISGTGKCAKAEASNAIEAGDRPGHMLVVSKNSCAWTAAMEMAGLKSMTYTAAVSSDITGGKSQDRGYVVMTMDNGDKAYVRFQGTGTSSPDGARSGEGTWSYTGGTGKLKGLKGKGTFKSSGSSADVTEDQVEGEYSLPEAAAKSKAKKD
jgi:hypothetical protein